MTLPVVAIVGRPNVGKSTLFNRIVGVHRAAVHDRPGVTRDRLYEEAEALDRQFMVIDTGGLEPAPETGLLAAMRYQSLVAIEEADVIVFVVDGRQGFTPADDEIADTLRRSHKPVILVVNKIDGPKQEDLGADFYQLGIDPILTLSAAHGRGMYELTEAIVERLPPAVVDEGHASDDQDQADRGDDEEDDIGEPIDAPTGGPIRIAVIGRPNIGKSTLINALIGEERHVVHDSPGTTMDPVDSALTVGDRDYVLVDTAGVRRKSRIDDQLERYISIRSIRAIERCHISILMIDGTVGPTDQDAKLADLVIGRGRALIILVNKWDIAKDLEEVSAQLIEEAFERKLPHATWAPHLFISAKTKKGLHRVFPLIEEVFAQFERRLGTPEMNRFLERAIQAHSPPQQYHKPVRLYYATQNRVRPPTMVFFSNTPEGVPDSYKRYLANRLRETYGFRGTPLRMHFRARRKLGEGEEGSE